MQSIKLLARVLLVLSLFTFGAGSRPASAAGEFPLKGGERIIFFGDSITQGGAYVTDVELYLMTRFPSQRFTVINHGISSETISGTSEPDHNPRRPDAHDRFHRDVAAWNPDVVIACFGMNDGNYHPFDEERFQAYQAGVNRLIDRVRTTTKARLVLLTPPPFDPYRRQVGDPTAIHYGYKFPAVDYDRTLDHYAKWLLTLRQDDRVVADVHQVMNDHLAARRRERVSFFLAPDAVHPDSTGHLLMAQILLQAWDAPALVSEAVIDAESKTSSSEGVGSVEVVGDGLSAVWTTKLPMPVNPSCDVESLAVAKIAETLNQHRLVVKNLKPGTYLLSASTENRPEVEVGSFTDKQLADGLNLTALDAFPTNGKARELFRELTALRSVEYTAWRKQIDTSPSPSPDSKTANNDRDAIRKLSGPLTVTLRLAPQP